MEFKTTRELNDFKMYCAVNGCPPNGGLANLKTLSVTPLRSTENLAYLLFISRYQRDKSKIKI